MLPVRTPNNSDNTAPCTDRDTLTLNSCTNGVIPRATSTPSTAPTRLVKLASNKNSNRISFREQPSAFRIPISLVRSLMDTNNTFIMPIPPTINTITAMEINSNVSVSLEAEAASILLPASLMVNVVLG